MCEAISVFSPGQSLLRTCSGEPVEGSRAEHFWILRHFVPQNDVFALSFRPEPSDGNRLCFASLSS